MPIHAAAVVGNRQLHVVAGGEFRTVGAIRRVDRHIGGVNDQTAGPVNGVAGVDREIGEHLADLGGVHPHLPEIGARIPLQVDVLADQTVQHLQRSGDGLVEIKNPGRDHLFAGKGQQLPGQVSRVSGRLVHLVQPFVKRMLFLQLV